MAPVRTNRKKLLLGAGILLPFLLVAAFLYYATRPVDRTIQTASIIIPKGCGFREIVEIIDTAGFIRNRPFFYLLALCRGATGQIRAGEYELTGVLSPDEIITKLVRGEIKQYKVTFPEDTTAREIADRLVKNRLIDERTFMNLLADRTFLATLGIDGPTAEGYLYPSTYFLNRSMTERDIIRMMVRQFWSVVTPEMRRRAAAMGFSFGEIVTLASMIGKETGDTAEKPMISAVFHNRLRQGMKLQSDPTTVYQLARHQGTVTKHDLRRPTTHNTYRLPGLPPGPIANPGRDSLQAALSPAPAPYLYFVARGDGTHYFSRNLTEHNRALRRFYSTVSEPPEALLTY